MFKYVVRHAVDNSILGFFDSLPDAWEEVEKLEWADVPAKVYDEHGNEMK